ncbi:hypothetical protein DH2020_034555 [Rehmannia glutinosa]|uniref:pyruvate kinase n=1 Tax=Rehmannia glutinosa TaxID=99300 RepID=A0ABR0V9V9_REHGL
MAQALNIFISTSHSPKPLISYRSAPFSTAISRFSFIKIHKNTSLFIKASASDPNPAILTTDNGAGSAALQDHAPSPTVSDSSSIEVDTVTEVELKENGFRSTRRTKLICTIGPATCKPEQLEALAVGGMNVARINMCHGTREWHREVIQRVRKLNEEKGYAVAIMMDTEGSEIHMGDLGGASSAKAEDGEIWTFSVRAFDSDLPEHTINVNYDGFAEDVKVGDELLVDGGMVRFELMALRRDDVHRS